MISPWRLTVVVSLLLGGAACDGESATSDVVVVDTIAGVETVTNPVTHRPTLEWTVGAPQLELGRLDGEGADVFGSVNGVAVDEGGRIYVADGQAMELRVFMPTGVHLRTFGRKGQGPGEFENIDAVRLTPDDELLVRDIQQSRVSVFGPEGDFRRQIRLERPYPQFQLRPTLWADTAGRIYDWLFASGGDGDSVGVAVYAASGEPEGRVLAATPDAEQILLRQGERTIASMPVPLSGYASAAVDRSGRILFGVGDVYELELRDARGRLLRRIRREVPPTPRPRALTDTIRARLNALAQRMGGGAWEEYELPEHLPYFAHVMVDDLDNWWIARNGDENNRLPTEYDVFAPEGHLLGTLDLPPMRVMQIGPDFVAGVAIDELGVQRVVILPLSRADDVAPRSGGRPVANMRPFVIDGGVIPA